MSLQVSVIIPTYNYGRFIGEAIQSVLGQTLRPTDIIVVDDGSTDGTRLVVERLGETVRYIHQENAGVSAARNRGVEESGGDLIAFLDADDIWEPTKLATQATIFHDPEIGLVHCGMREFDSESGETIKEYTEGLEGEVADDLLLWERPAVIGPGGTIVVSRKAFDEVGGFDTRLKVGEDWDFCYRVARKYRVGFVREPLVNYRSHEAAAHRNILEMERGMTRFYNKAFAEGGDVLRLRRRSMANFNRVLAGSYFQAGMYSDFLRTGLKAVAYDPTVLVRSFPSR